MYAANMLLPAAAAASARLSSIIIGFMAAFLLTGEARAASFTVNSIVDAHDARPGDQRCAAASGLCTLRAAIEEANALRSSDSIRFRMNQVSVIALSLGQLEIKGLDTLRIEGPGAALLSIDAGGKSRVLRVAPDVTAYVSGLTLRNGYVDRNEFGDREFGAGLENLGTVALRGVVIRGNRAPQGGGGIVNGGDLTFIRSAVRGNSAIHFAGGILNGGSMWLSESDVSNNYAYDGAGGIDNRGTAVLSGATVKTNTSMNRAAGIDSRGTLKLIGTVVSENNGHDAAGGIENFGSLSLFRSKITKNHSKLTGGIAGTRGDIVAIRSAVAGNWGKAGLVDANADCLLSPISAFRSGGRNLFGKETGCIAGRLDNLASGSVENQTKLPAIAAATVSLNIRVNASSDDAEESSAGAINLTSGDLELVQESTNQKVGVRFKNVTVPKGATISNAWIQFTADEVQSEPTSLLIQGQLADNAPAFTTTSGNISSRTRTVAGVSWSPADWTTIGQAGPAQRTSDLTPITPIVQEIVRRSGWSSGNAMVFIVTGTGHRTADSYNGGSAVAPLLHIEYESATGNQPPVVNAGADKTITLPSGVSLSGSVSDDGLPNPPAAVTCDWTKTSGPGSASFANASSPTTTATFSTSGSYVLRLACSDSALQAFDEANVTVNAAGSASIAVYAGYYDTHHPNRLKPKPNPWQGSSGATFVGTPDTASGGWDTSAVRVDNLTGSTLSNVVVTVDVGSRHKALWGTRSIPAGGKLVLAQTSFGNFDGSDYNTAGCYNCNPALCTSAISSTIPVVKVTVNGTTTTISDLGQVINTHGVDSAGCPYTGTRNDESQDWLRIH